MARRTRTTRIACAVAACLSGIVGAAPASADGASAAPAGAVGCPAAAVGTDCEQVGTQTDLSGKDPGEPYSLLVPSDYYRDKRDRPLTLFGHPSSTTDNASPVGREGSATPHRDLIGDPSLGTSHVQASAFARPRLPVTAVQCLADPFVPDPSGLIVSPDSEGWGPTPINAQSANGRLAVGFDRLGTVTVFKWPTPSTSNQIKYFTYDRRAARMGALINEGSFLGLAIGGRTSWLRDWPTVRQRFVDDSSDEVQTVYTNPELHLQVTVNDVVGPAFDVLARRVEVRRIGLGPVPSAVMVFENFNLVASKLPDAPGRDFCEQRLNNDAAFFDRKNDAIVHDRSDIDVSTGLPSEVSVAIGGDRRSTAHEVGGDAQVDPVGALLAPDAYDQASADALSGHSSFSGQTTGALKLPLAFRGSRASAEVFLAAAHNPAAALASLQRARAAGERTLAAAKGRWLAQLLQHAPLPRTRDEQILAVARRALVLLVTNADAGGSIPAAISTQPPYGEDWPRDGSFFNYALDLAGLHAMVAHHNSFYAQVQATATSQPRGSLGIPPGNWAMNYYSDGVVGGPIPWEIDETGFAIWSFEHHYEVTRNLRWLRSVYPVIRRAADFLASCRDAQNRLQCRATEDDNFNIGQQQTIAGAATTWMGLDRAVRAAVALRQDGDAARWRARRDELGNAIDAVLWDPGSRSYGGGEEYGAYLMWPAEFRPADPGRLAGQADYLWSQIAPSFDAPHGVRTFGLYESKDLIALARYWRVHDPGRLALVRRGLRWIAHVEATPDTHVLGETWRVFDGQVITTTAMPQLWEHTLFYLATLDTFGAERRGWR